MSTHGKSASSQKTLNFYGTLAGAIAWRLDWLTAIIANGNFIWQCGSSPLDTTPGGGLITADGYIDLTSSILDPTLLMEGGYLWLYPGVATANQNPDLVFNSAYRDRAYLVAKRIFFGQNSGTAPNLQIIGGAKPKVPNTIVADADNIIDDRQVNPIACAAEVLLDERGGSMLEAQLDAPSWLASAHFWAQDQAHRDFSFISPLLTEQVPVRELVKRWLEPLSTFLRWTPAGKLGCFVYEWGTDPGGLLTLDARHWISGKRPKIQHAEWNDIPTALNVSFTDRGYQFQNNNVEVPNQRAADIRQLDDPKPLERPEITRSWQAQRHGQEWFRRISGTATLYVRAPVIAGVQPGDKIKFDDDPEPGDAGLAQLARVDKITIDRTDAAELELTIDPLLPAVAYTPAWTSPLPESLFPGAVESSPSLVHMLALPLPPQSFGWPPAVGFLATRPSGKIAGFHAYFSTDPLLPFTELGAQTGFAARCQLVNAVGAGAGTLRLQLLDGAAGNEAYLAADTPGGNDAMAQDNTLLAVLVSLDGSGRVAIDGAGEPIMEFASILQRSAVTADTHDYTVYRGRCSLAARAWGAAAVAWIVPRANLVPWQHELFSALFGAVGYFRLASFTSAAIDESSPLPETDLVFPTAYAADLPAEYTIVLSSETIAVACDNAGAPLAGQLGFGGTTFTTVTVLRSGNPLAAVAAGPGANQFSISIAAVTNCTATKETNTKVRADTLTADQGSIAIDVLVGGTFTVRKTLTLSKAKAGSTGATGPTGASGATGATGDTGPGLVYRGLYDATKTYYDTATRRDVVKDGSGGAYYLTNNLAKSGTNTWGVPTGGDWAAFGASFSSVATELLLAVDATIIKTLVMGDGSTADAGIIRSNGASAFGTGAGYWLNPHNGSGYAEFRVGDPSAQHLSFDGTNIEAVIDGGGSLIIGPASGKHFRFWLNTGVAELQLLDGATVKGSWSFVGSTATLDLLDPTTAILKNAYEVDSQRLRAFSSADPRTSDAPLKTDGGAWIEKSLDQRGPAYFNDVVEFHNDAKVMDGNLLRFPRGSTDTYISDNWGVSLRGDGTHPVNVRNAALCLSGCGFGGASYTTGRFYITDSVYLHEVSGVLYLNDGNGDRALT